MRLTRLVRSPRHPWSIARHITDALLVAAGRLYLGATRRTLRVMAHRYLGTDDLQALPPAERRLATGLCAAGTLLLFLALGYLAAGKGTALGAVALAALCYLLAGRVLTYTAWGTTFPGAERWAEFLRRLVEVIRHGAP